MIVPLSAMAMARYYCLSNMFGSLRNLIGAANDISKHRKSQGSVHTPVQWWLQVRGLSIVLVCVLFSSSSFNPMEAIKKSRIVIHSTLYCVCWFTGTSTGHTTPQSPCLYLCTPVNLLYTHPKGPKKVRILLLVVKKYTAEEEYKETISNSRSEISSSSAAHRST